MNFSVAAIVAGSAFLLSLLSGLIGGVPILDILLRALIWAVVGFGASLGIESLLRSLVPELFQAPEESTPPEERVQGASVNIAVDEELPLRTGGFIEEVEEGEEPVPSPRRALEPQEEAPAVSVVHREVAPVPEGDEEMPEIGSFLDAFKPEAEATGEEGAPTSAPEYADYAPVDSGRGSTPGEVTIDGEVQDPALLARAVQTVLKRDAQGN